MFLGCTLMMAALAASAAMTTALRARMENDHDAETPNKCASLRCRVSNVAGRSHLDRLVGSTDF